MRNININLTSDQAVLVDKNAAAYGFANRSEFFRAMLRYIFNQSPEILPKLDEVYFGTPSTRSVESIKSGLIKSGKYNKAFLSSVGRGLNKSRYFKK